MTPLDKAADLFQKMSLNSSCDNAHTSPRNDDLRFSNYQDAFILATLLGHRLTTLETVHNALSIYDQIRRPVAMEVAERSLINGRLFGLQLPGVSESLGDNDDDMKWLPKLGDAIKHNWEWTWSTTLDGAVQQAVRMLESGGTTSRAHSSFQYTSSL